MPPKKRKKSKNSKLYQVSVVNFQRKKDTGQWDTQNYPKDSISKTQIAQQTVTYQLTIALLTGSKQHLVR